MKEQLMAFYEKWGFKIYTGAFSHYYNTENSVSNMINFSSKKHDKAFFDENHHLLENRYFQILTQNGYGISVLEPTHVRYCTETSVILNHCVTSPYETFFSANSLDLPYADKLKILSSVYLNHSYAYKRIRNIYNTYAPARKTKWFQFPEWTWENVSKMHSVNTFFYWTDFGMIF